MRQESRRVGSIRGHDRRSRRRRATSRAALADHGLSVPDHLPWLERVPPRPREAVVPGAIWERRHALEWILDPEAEDWDAIALNT